MITLVYSVHPDASGHRVEKILDWTNYSMPEDRLDDIEETIFQLNERYRGEREVRSKHAQNLLVFFQENPEFAPNPALNRKDSPE